MKRLIAVCLLFALAVPTFAGKQARIDPRVTPSTPVGDREVTVPADAPGIIPWHNELDEIIGDTVVVGSTYWDTQHNGQVGRMVGFTPGDDDNPATAYVIWMKLDGPSNGSTRHIRMARVEMDDAGGMDLYVVPSPVDGEPRAGYTTLAMDAEMGNAFPAFHTAFGSPDSRSRIAAESVFVPDFFSTFIQEPLGGNAQCWPHAVYGSNGFAHVVTHEVRSGNVDPMRITYQRWAWDPNNAIFTAATPSELPRIITTDGMNISGDVATSADGQNVAITQTVSREFTLDEVWSDGGTQFNNDVYLWESTDGGDTWDFDSPENVTNFIGPDGDLLPDSMAANKDSLRAYTDGSVIYDSENNVHVAFSTPEYFPVWDAGYVYSHIFHWDRASGLYTQIADASSPDSLIGQAEAWGRAADRPSLYSDPDTGILWCLYRKVSSYPDTFDVVDNNGAKANSDVWITASPPGTYNGKLWAKGVNLTRTIWRGPNPPEPGESRSEMDPSLSVNNDGDYLFISYVQDLDPGSAISDPAEGIHTDSPFILHRVAKQAVIDQFEEQAEWLPNYPMHIDSSGFWEDDQSYAWAEAGGFFRTGSFVPDRTELQPDQFELNPAYPNPFNPSTQLSFRLGAAASVKLTVYDLLGREVATLVNRPMAAGQHQVTFLADDLASGVYFVRLTSGDLARTQKIMLMK
ncbi:T9SS type A sorting domain-containing protein [bacterium]|nr:T9SS type A sorting domain-containing protein [bacterium]